MLHAVVGWLAAVGFVAAGLINVRGSPATRRDFVRWGYPAWWCLVTGGIEIVVAALIALPATRLIGVMVGAVVIAAAVITVLRHRDYPHLGPLGAFAALLALAAFV